MGQYITVRLLPRRHPKGHSYDQVCKHARHEIIEYNADAAPQGLHFPDTDQPILDFKYGSEKAEEPWVYAVGAVIFFVTGAQAFRSGRDGRRTGR